MWSAESVLVSGVEVIHDLGCRQKFWCLFDYYGDRTDCFDVLAKSDHQLHPFLHAHITVSLRLKL